MFNHKIDLRNVKMWQPDDVDDLTAKIENIHHRLALLEEAIDKLGYKANPVEEPPTIDLRTINPRQRVKIKVGAEAVFIGIDYEQKNYEYRFVFLMCDGANVIQHYRGYGEDGKTYSDESGEWDIVEILPIEENR